MTDESPRYDFDSDRVVDALGNPFEPEPVDADRFMATMARFMIEGDERDEARLLLSCTLSSSDWYGDFSYHCLELTFHGPRRVYELLSDNMSNAYRVFDGAAKAVSEREFDGVNINARAALASTVSADWRNELLAVLDGTDVDNQCVAFRQTRDWEGLRFRSESEVRIAQALDRAGVMFLPNCKARLGSTDRRRNSEADFVVMLNGRWGVLEVDGGEWHPPARAAQDHERDRPFLHHGAKYCQRFDAGECFENPDRVVAQFLALLKRAD